MRLPSVRARVLIQRALTSFLIPGVGLEVSMVVVGKHFTFLLIVV